MYRIPQFKDGVIYKSTDFADIVNTMLTLFTSFKVVKPGILWGASIVEEGGITYISPGAILLENGEIVVIEDKTATTVNFGSFSQPTSVWVGILSDTLTYRNNLAGISVAVSKTPDLTVTNVEPSTTRKVWIGTYAPPNIFTPNFSLSGLTHTDQVVDGYYTGPLLTGASLQARTITSDKIAEGAITTTELADNSVSTSKIQDGAVTKEKIASGVTLELDSRSIKPNHFGSTGLPNDPRELNPIVSIKGPGGVLLPGASTTFPFFIEEHTPAGGTVSGAAADFEAKPALELSDWLRQNASAHATFLSNEGTNSDSLIHTYTTNLDGPGTEYGFIGIGIKQTTTADIFIPEYLKISNKLLFDAGIPDFALVHTLVFAGGTSDDHTLISPIILAPDGYVIDKVTCSPPLNSRSALYTIPRGIETDLVTQVGVSIILTLTEGPHGLSDQSFHNYTHAFFIPAIIELRRSDYEFTPPGAPAGYTLHKDSNLVKQVAVQYPTYTAFSVLLWDNFVRQF